MVTTTQALKFRYLLGESAFPRQKFSDVKQTAGNQENDGVASNGILTAMAWTQASSVAVWKADDFKRFDANIPLIKGHNGAITDLMFSPFHDQLLASSSEDGKCKLWMIPEGGLTSHVMNEDMALLGHSKKVLSVRWHNSVENLLATASIDNTIKIWDVNEGKAAFSFNFANFATSMQWKPDGKVLGTMIKGSQMAFFDPRAESSVWQQASHEGTKA